MNDRRTYGILKHTERKSVHHRPPPPPPPPPPKRAATVTATTAAKGVEIKSSNKLLAGYMAHEFRTKGTVLGHKFDADTAEKGKLRPVAENERYKEITSLLMIKSDGGVQIPGIVNPTQLARWIQM